MLFHTVLIHLEKTVCNALLSERFPRASLENGIREMRQFREQPREMNSD